MSAIRNAEYAGQLIDYEGMTYGKCRPTDIDQSIDFQGKTFVFTELKYGSTPLTPGQKYHLQHLVKGLRRGGCVAYAVLCSHITPPSEQVVSRDASVIMYFDGNTWQRPDSDMTHHQFVQEVHDDHQQEKER